MFDQLKYLMHNGERYIVVESGKPEYVFMRFDDYAAMAKANKADNPGHGESPSKNPRAWERADSEMEEFGIRGQSTAMPVDFTTEPMSMNTDPTTIRLEDLPL